MSDPEEKVKVIEVEKPIQERGKIDDLLKNITTVDGLMPYAGQVIKYSIDNGRTWKLGKLWPRTANFNDGSYGFGMILPVENGVHSRWSITDKYFAKRGHIVRPATPKEYEGVEFSYE